MVVLGTWPVVARMGIACTVKLFRPECLNCMGNLGQKNARIFLSIPNLELLYGQKLSLLLV